MKRIVAIFVIVVVLFAASLAMAFPAVQVYKKTASSVVLIVASTGSSGGSMLGTGSIITSSGMVITNAHVVIDSDTGKPFPKVRVYTKPDEVTGDLSRDLVNPHVTTVLAYNVDLDLAVLQARGLSVNQGTITLANAREIMVGEEVVAIGHPEQGGLWTLTYGRISSQIINQSNVKGKNVFQTDTALNRGNSGGPLLDRRGYMVGVNTNIARRGSDDLAITGVNFALKSSVVSRWLGTQGIVIAYGKEALYPESAESQPVVKSEPARPARPAIEDKPAPVAEPEPKEMAQAAKPEPAEPVTKVEKAPATKAPYMAKERKREPRYGRSPRADSSAQAVRKPASKHKAMDVAAKPAKPVKSVKSDSGKKYESGDVLTPKKPFTQKDLFEQVEIELEDMMKDMRMNFR